MKDQYKQFRYIRKVYLFFDKLRVKDEQCKNFVTT